MGSNELNLKQVPIENRVGSETFSWPTLIPLPDFDKKYSSLRFAPYIAILNFILVGIAYLVAETSRIKHEDALWGILWTIVPQVVMIAWIQVARSSKVAIRILMAKSLTVIFTSVFSTLILVPNLLQFANGEGEGAGIVIFLYPWYWLVGTVLVYFIGLLVTNNCEQKLTFVVPASHLTKPTTMGVESSSQQEKATTQVNVQPLPGSISSIEQIWRFFAFVVVGIICLILTAK